MLNRDDYRKFINADKPLTNTSAYARIERATGTVAWRAVCCYHLPGEINNRMLVAFCDVLRDGQWANAGALRIAYTWQGKTDGPLYRPFEKRPPEPRAQVDLYKGQVTTVWVDDPAYPSDRVVGIHSDVEDGQGGNVRFHNSFICYWQLLKSSTIIPPIDPPVIDSPVVPPSNAAILAQLDVVQAELAKLRRML